MKANERTLKNLTTALGKKCRLTHRDAAMVSDALFSILADYMTRQKTVKITGLGTFSVKTRAARQAFNVHTQQPTVYPPYKTVYLKPCRAIKTAINADKQSQPQA